MPKLTTREQQVLRTLVAEAMVRRFSIMETQSYIKAQLGTIIGEREILRYRKQVKTESSKWLSDMAKSRTEFIAEYRQRIKECEEIQRELWRTYLLSKDLPAIRVKCLAELLKASNQILEMYDALPVVYSLTGTGQIHHKIEKDEEQIQIERELEHIRRQENAEQGQDSGNDDDDEELEPQQDNSDLV